MPVAVGEVRADRIGTTGERRPGVRPHCSPPVDPTCQTTVGTDAGNPAGGDPLKVSPREVAGAGEVPCAKVAACSAHAIEAATVHTIEPASTIDSVAANPVAIDPVTTNAITANPVITAEATVNARGPSVTNIPHATAEIPAATEVAAAEITPAEASSAEATPTKTAAPTTMETAAPHVATATAVGKPNHRRQRRHDGRHQGSRRVSAPVWTSHG